jgi:hypothetical protein
MAGETGLNIVKDGLVFYIDAANSNSYISGSTKWNDLSRGGSNGTLINSPTYNSSNGGSIVFDGVDDYIDCGNSSTILVGNTLSCFVWAYIGSTTAYQPMAAKVTGTYDSGWEISNSNGIARVTLRPAVAGNNNVSAGTFVINTWNYVGFTCDNVNIRLYLNNVLTGTTAVSSVTLNSIENLTIGKRAAGNLYIGRIANTSIYNRALSTTEITQNFNTMKSRFNI